MDLQDFLILGKHDPRNTHATLFKAKDHLFCCFSDDECFFDVYIQYLHLVPKRQKRCVGKKRNQREFIPPLFFRWHCPRRNGDMNICIKKNFEWFLGPFLANQGQVRKKNPLKKSEFFGFLYFLFMNWICEFG